LHHRVRCATVWGAQRLSNSKLPALDATIALVILRVTLGALFVSTFFENMGKRLYSAEGYAGLIRSYIKYGHAPAVWKQVMGFTAAHAAIAGPLQGVLEPSLGVLLILGFFSRAAALVAFGFLTGLWVSEWGIGWIWELLVPMVVAAALTLGPSGQRAAVDVALARRGPQLTI
jgi:uncharacterized membrane protein YphA (DoxX/SURF4 family)